MDDLETSSQNSPSQNRRRAVRARARRRQEKNHRDMVWNVLSILIWLGTGGLLLIFIIILTNPFSSVNPFQPVMPTLAQSLLLPTDTPTPDFTATIVTNTPGPTDTPTAIPPTATLEPTATETATPGPTPTATINSVYPFILRNDPVVIAGNAIPNHEACKLWVAGQTYDLQNAPMVGITVMLGGTLNGKNLYQLALTGTALQFGQAGYEFTIADSPVKTRGTIWVQLYDQALIPLSSKVYFDTYENCDNNLILINFRQVR